MKISRRQCRCLNLISSAMLLGSILWIPESPAQMVDPSIDKPGEPFSYFSQPADVIGVMDAGAGTEVTPEGYLYTGFGELMFFAGSPEMPIRQRVKTPMRGYLPIIEYTYQQQGISYQFTMFAATLDGKPEGTLVNFVRVTIRNGNAIETTAHFAAGVRYENQVNESNGVGDNRFRRPATPKRTGEYAQVGEEFKPNWIYGFSENGLVRDGKVIYLFPDAPKPELRLTLKEPYNYPPDIKAKALPIAKDTPVGIVHYKLRLTPGEQTQLVLKMPCVPVESSSPELAKIRSASFDKYLQDTIGFWDDILLRGIDITLPEEKVNDTFKVNLIYDLIARDKVGDQYVQTVNKFHYHAFWLRDSSYIARMYDVSGYHEYARQVLDFFAGWQQPDGNFVSQGGQFDGWGQTLWAYGQHYRITHDKAFAQQVYPSVQRAIAWLEKARQADPLHLMPATRPGDNEEITGHVTGHNFWALGGLKNAIILAQAVGNQQDAEVWEREYVDYRSTLMNVLKRVTATTGGYIPPGLDGQHGQDWGNMLSIYPEGILDPLDPMVTATLNATRAKYEEGIMTYLDGQLIHHYLTIKNTDTEVIRGDQQTSIEELYALLLHTSSTHAGFEYAIRPWGMRDFGLNLSPHGWFAAKFRTLVRNMVVREQGYELHLLSSISPEWVGRGKTISVRRAPTNFGEVNFEWQVPSEGASVISLSNELAYPPEKLVLHLPWFLDVQEVYVDGKTVTPANGSVTLPVDAKQVRLRWTRRAGTPAMSYDRAVEDYKAEYKRRYDRFIQTGETQP